jgi:hypothetical protein
MRFFTTTALALMIGSPLLAEEQIACTMMGCEKVNIEVSDFAGANSFSVQEVWSVVNDILSVSGLAPNFQVIETEDVGNASAVIIKEQRYLAFNPVWMNTYKGKPDSRWQLYAVMAHEVGHHLQGHTILAGGSRPPTELEADEYAGFTLAALGASLAQAQALFNTLSTQGSATHPPRHQRLDAVQRGWERQRGTAAPAPAAQNPAPNQRQVARAPAVNGETCYNMQLTLGNAQVCASSTLNQQKSNTYGLTNLFDGDRNTAWVEGAPGNGEGQQISVSFDAPVTINEIVLINGYAKSSKSFNDNARIQNLSIQSSTNISGDIALLDQSQDQSYTIKGLENVEWITFGIGSVYPGAKWQDTAISEIRFR